MASPRRGAQARRRPDSQMTDFERVVCAVTLAAVVAVIVVFLLVFHDFPLRVT